MNRFEYAVPAGLPQALAALKAGRDKPGTVVAKGAGVDLIDLMKDRIVTPARLIDLNAIPALRYIRVEGGALKLGPTATLSDIAAHGETRAQFAAIAQAAQSAASPNIRNRATVAGNLLQRPRCWYYRNPEFVCLKKGGTICFAHKGENKYHAIFGGGPSYIVHPSTMATALVAYGAIARIARDGEKPRDLPVEKLFLLPDSDETREHVLAPDELITEIVVPKPEDGTKSVFVSAKEREGYDWPLGEAAAVLAMKGGKIQRASVVLGAAAPVPWRAAGAEKALIGAAASPDAARAAGKAAIVGAKPLGDNGYKVPLFQALVEQAVAAAAGIAGIEGDR